MIRQHSPEEASRAIARDYPAAVDVGSGQRGVLMDPEWALTAAHVVQSVEPFGGRMTIGASHSSGGGKTVAIDRVILLLGSRLGRMCIKNDTALVRLAERVEDVEPTPVNKKSDERGKEVVPMGDDGFRNGESGATKGDRIRGTTNRVAE